MGRPTSRSSAAGFRFPIWVFAAPAAAAGAFGAYNYYGMEHGGGQQEEKVFAAIERLLCRMAF